jgi:hypothetical protein
MSDERSALRNWMPAELAFGRGWVQAWRDAGRKMEQLRRQDVIGIIHAVAELQAPCESQGWQLCISPRLEHQFTTC